MHAIYYRMNRHQNLIDSANNASNTDASNADDIAEVTSSTCRLCDKGEETPFHLVLECEEMKMNSYRCLGNQNPNHDRRNYKFRWKVHKFIAFLAKPTLNPLLGLGEPEDDDGIVDNDGRDDQDDDAQQMSLDEDNSNNNENETDPQTEDTTMRDLFNGYCRGI